MSKIDRGRRIQLAKQADEIRFRRLAVGDNIEVIAKTIARDLPEILPTG